MRKLVRTPTDALLALCAMVCVAYFALWACAPAATVRPDLPMANGKSVGVGVGGTAGLLPRTNCTKLASSTSADGCAAGHLWVHIDTGSWFEFGVVGFVGDINLLGVGPYARFRLVTEDNFRMSLDASAGFLWFAAGLPMALRVSNGLWVYTEPSVGMRMFNAGRLPLGVAMDLGMVRVHAELGLGTGTGDVRFDLERMIGYGSAGVEFAF